MNTRPGKEILHPVGRGIIRALLLAASTALPAQLASAQDLSSFDMSREGLRLDDMIGRTLVAATNGGSSPWSTYLSTDGRALFHFSSGKRAEATWRRAAEDVICFTGLIAEKPRKEICKRADALGRGLDWMTVVSNDKGEFTPEDPNASRGSSQIIFSYPGQVEPPQDVDLAEPSAWAGKIVLGRTLKDREPWLMRVQDAEKLTIVFASGRAVDGSYEIKEGKFCMDLPEYKPASGCRDIQLDNDKLLWPREGGKATSELLLLVPETVGGPHLIKQASEHTNWMRSTPGGRYSLGVERKTQMLEVLDKTSGELIASRAGAAAPHDVEMSATGKHVAVTYGDGSAEVFSVPDLNIVNVLEAPQDDKFNEPDFSADGTRLVIGSNKGGLYEIDLKNSTAGPMMAGASEARISDLKFLGDGRVVALHSDGKAELFNADLTLVEGSAIDLPSKTWLLQPLPAGDKIAFAAENTVGIWDLTAGTSRVSEALGESTVKDLALMPQTGELLVAIDNKLRGLNSETLAVRDLAAFPFSNLQSVQPAGPTPDGVVMTVSKPAGADLWALDLETLRAAETELGAHGASWAEQARSDAALAKVVSTRYGKTVREAIAKYDGGDCTAFALAVPNLRLADRPEQNCERAAEIRDARKELADLLGRDDCDAADRLAEQYDFGRFGVNKCIERREKKARRARYFEAISANDCATLETLAKEFGNADTVTDCEVRKAETGDARQAYFAAVKFDTERDFGRAERIYRSIMSRFPDDDLALQAATRLTDLADLRAKAAAEAAAVAAAEKRAEEAERRAQEAERQRQADKKAQEEKERKQASIRTYRTNIREAMAKLNDTYSFPSKSVKFKGTVKGTNTNFSYYAKGHFSISPRAAGATTASELCRVKISSGITQDQHKIYTSGNSYVWVEDRSMRFNLDMDYHDPDEAVGEGLFGKHLAKKQNGYRYETYSNDGIIMASWAAPYKILKNNPGDRNIKRKTFIQIPPSLKADDFIKDFERLAAQCYLATLGDGEN